MADIINLDERRREKAQEKDPYWIADDLVGGYMEWLVEDDCRCESAGCSR